MQELQIAEANPVIPLFFAIFVILSWIICVKKIWIVQSKPTILVTSQQSKAKEGVFCFNER